MPITVQCPICRTAARIPATASVATCPKCLTTFSADGEVAPQLHAAVPEQARQETSSQDTWVNSYGVVAISLATLALLSANLVAVRMVTIVLVILGLLVVALGLVAGKAERESKDWVWLALGSALNGVVLFVVLVRPGLLNAFWGLDVAPDEPDPQQLIVVPRRQPNAPGKPLSADDWVDPSNDAIRQGKLLVRIDSVKGGSRLQIHLQIVNLGSEAITLAGFGGANTPTLTDASGRSFVFLKRQKRSRGEGPPAFEDVPDQAVELQAGERQDILLMFETPSRVDPLKLEMPASAWGRNGRCKFNIAGLFTDY